MQFDSEREKDVVDIVTTCMLSISFLKEISNVIFSTDRDKVTVGQFYDEWLSGTNTEWQMVPFNFGIIIGYIYCGILLTKEYFFELLPETEFRESDLSWGITDALYKVPGKSNVSLKYAVRRIRNALGHGSFKIEVPNDMKDKSEIMKRVTLHLHDVNMNDPSDTFDISLTINQLAKFIRSFQATIYSHVNSKTLDGQLKS